MEEQKWKFTDFADMLKNPPKYDQETDDKAYRAGYREGWIHAIESLEKGLSTDAYHCGWDFWENELRMWVFEEKGSCHFPPNYDYKRPKQLPGRFPSLSLRYAVFKRDGFRCQLCGISASVAPHVVLEVDHKISVSKGGKTTMANLWTLCRECNRGKGISDL